MTTNPGKSWLLLHSPPGASAYNMALDEALLEAMPRLAQPVLRFYSWTEPAASFGYFQKYSDVSRLTALRPLVRRPTAGGIVPHDRDWTYSLVWPAQHPWHSLSAAESYRRVHQWLQAALAQLGLYAQIAASARKTAPGQCFAGYEISDVLFDGQKVAGAAQRRRRDGLLVQGSVQPLANWPPRAAWNKALCDHAREHFGAEWIAFSPDPALHARAEELAAEKYSQAAYNHRR